MSRSDNFKNVNFIFKNYTTVQSRIKELYFHIIGKMKNSEEISDQKVIKNADSINLLDKIQTLFDFNLNQLNAIKHDYCTFSKCSNSPDNPNDYDVLIHNLEEEVRNYERQIHQMNVSLDALKEKNNEKERENNILKSHLEEYEQNIVEKMKDLDRKEGQILLLQKELSNYKIKNLENQKVVKPIIKERVIII